ncbi:MAG: heme lyase NrfEFG subunit NrfE, partial [Alsobacter sp.]
MIVEAGHYALVLGLALAMALAVIPAWGAAARDPALMSVARPAAFGMFGFVALAYAALTWAYVSSDFSVLNVVQNSHSQKPLVYRLTGVWANHEGSMLLWVLILVVFAALVAWRGAHMPQRL